MFVSRFAVPAAALAALATTASAQTSSQGLTILSPGGPNLWWVAQSINVIAWTCHTTTLTNYTVLVGNSNPSVQSTPQAILAQENNFDCSKQLDSTQLNFAPGDGWFVQFADPFNQTNVYAQSADFEIKPLGSSYPDPSATPTAGGNPVSGATSTSSSGAPGTQTTGSGAAQASGSGASSQSPAPTHTNAALATKASFTGLAAFAAAALGVVLA